MYRDSTRTARFQHSLRSGLYFDVPVYRKYNNIERLILYSCWNVYVNVNYIPGSNVASVGDYPITHSEFGNGLMG